MESMTSTNKKRFDWQSVWVAVIALSFVFRVYVMLDPRQELSYELLFSLLYVALAARALQCESFRARADFRLTALCFCWAAISCALPRYEERETMQLAYYFLMMVFGLFVCYPLAFVLKKERAQRALGWIAAVYFVLIALLCGAGVYAALANVTLPSLAGEGYVAAGMSVGRLLLFCYPTIAATFCCLGLIVGFYLFLRWKRALARAACILAMLVMFVALALTDSRTSGIFFACCFGGGAFLIADTKLPVRRRALRALAAVGIAAVAVLACYGGLRASYQAVAAVRQAVSAEAVPEQAQAVQTVRLASKLSPAAAEKAPSTPEPEPEAAAEPGARSLFFNLSTLQGRTYVWEAALRMFQNEPLLLLTGTSPLFVMERVEPYVEQTYGGEAFTHLHSIFFQTLAAYGLPGLLLFGALVGYILYHALRLFFCGAGTCTLAERSLALLLFFCLAVDTMETFLSFFDVVKHSNPWFFLAGGYAVYLSQTRIEKRSRKRADV